MVSRVSIVVVLLAVSACGSWQRVGTERPPTPETVIPGLFEPSGAYREMGFLAAGAPVAFVGTVRYFAGPTPDSTLAIFSLSLANNTLSFQRSGNVFQAIYRVEASFRYDSTTRSITSDQAVKVPVFAETQRADESVIFQQTAVLPPGKATLAVIVRDVGTGGFSRDERQAVVPRFDHPSLSSLTPYYRGVARTGRDARPDLLANPRATIPYGADTLSIYLEAYGAGTGTASTIRALDEADTEVWRATPDLAGDSALRAATIRVPPGTLPIGRLRLEGWFAGSSDTVRTPLLVSFSEQWVVANFEGVLNLLRYFGEEEQIRAMRTAPDSTRSALWQKFWRDTDPNPSTPENEELDRYFARLQAANRRFREGNEAGWLTDRGEVFVCLGEPDEVFDQSSDLQRQLRSIRWSFTAERLVLEFVDESGFGRYRLTSGSRAEFQRVVNRVRRSN